VRWHTSGWYPSSKRVMVLIIRMLIRSTNRL